ncbi:MAG TPA: PAS domain S-box protein, partial [Isosphaeraceae bacterium]
MPPDEPDEPDAPSRDPGARPDGDPDLLVAQVRNLGMWAYRELRRPEVDTQAIDELLRQIDLLRGLIPALPKAEQERHALHLWVENLGHSVELTRAELKLRRAEAYYQSLVGTLAHGLFRKDREGRFTFVNGTFGSWLGRPPEAIVGRTDFDFFPDPQARQALKDELEVIATGRPFERVELVAWPDGVARWVSVAKARIEDERGRPIGLQALYWDVSSQDRAERCVAVQHGVTRVLAEASTLREATPMLLREIGERLGWEHGALWRVDAASRRLRCVETWQSPRAELADFEAETLGLSFAPGDGMPGRVWTSRRPVWIGDVTTEANFLRTGVAARRGLGTALGMPILRGSEVLGVLEFFGRRDHPAPDEALLATMAALGSQIGQYMERKRAEEEYDRLFNLSIDMFCVASFEGIYQLLNPAWERTLGYSRAELMARPYVEFVHPEDRAATHAAAEALTTGANIVTFENRYRCRDGSYKLLLWNAVPLPEERLIYAVARDMTALRRAEQAEQRRLQEEGAVREIQQRLFPHAAPELDDFEIAGASFPVGAAGGDYFDYIPMADGSLGVVVGDVSGHGLGPALLMASTRATLRGFARTEPDVGAILTRANAALASDL